MIVYIVTLVLSFVPSTLHFPPRVDPHRASLVGFVDICVDHTDCHRPMYCCEAYFFNVCCMNGVPVRAQNRTQLLFSR
jgi:hypothetical protein